VTLLGASRLVFGGVRLSGSDGSRGRDGILAQWEAEDEGYIDIGGSERLGVGRSEGYGEGLRRSVIGRLVVDEGCSSWSMVGGGVEYLAIVSN